MTLQSSASAGNPLTFSEIQAEFTPQGSESNFRAYLKNAGIVDSVNDVAPNVPTSGTMNILDFLSAQCVTFSAFTETFTSGSGSRTAPVGATSVVIKMWGGGGSGGGGSYTDYGGGGGGGGYVIKSMSVTGSITTFNWSVGTGGSIGGFDAEGIAGGASTITNAATLTAGGGARGRNGSSGGAGGSGGSSTGGDAGSEVGAAGGNAGGYGGNAGGIGDGGGAGGDGGVYGPVGGGGIPGGGGGGGEIDGAGGPGARGEIRFSWS